MVNIKDIARLANVSPSTVSKALNNQADISEATKERILAIAKELNYSPNAFGKGLKSRTTENLGVIFCRELQPLSGNPFYSRVLEGIEAEVALNNFNLILYFVPTNQQDISPKMVREHQVDGIILVGVFHPEFIQILNQSGLPIIQIDPKIRLTNSHQVLINNEDGASIATQYLINMGHKRIGFISGDLNRMSFQQRYDGYIKTLKYNRIIPDSDLVKSGGLEKGYDQVKELMLAPNRPTAIFAANDINAIYGYQAIHELGYEIPEDISMIGFDDIDLAKFSTPPLTTVRVYKEELGSLAVRALFKSINGELESPQTVIVPVKLVERESVKKLDVQ
ncbi:LacI family DNA-binding transcriptional regulator [candidate division KSB1 bacterium]|nr:LacI family DNA-binding transcriptional regulator [candidate division KSB1 bacterium]